MKNYSNGIRIYGNDLGALVKRIFIVLFALSFTLCFVFYILKLQTTILIVGSIFILLSYIGISNNQYSFFIQDGNLIIRNDYLFFIEERFKISLYAIDKLNYRFNNSEKNGTTHITLLFGKKKKKFKIIASLKETEPLLKAFKKLNIPLSFSNIQTEEQKLFAMKWLGNS